MKLAVILLGAIFLVTPVDEKQKCPISGKAADGKISLNVNGKKVAFCCDKCPKAYKKQINLVAKKKPGKCPITGKPAKENQQVIRKSSERVYFCCNDCPKEFAKKNKLAKVKDGGPKKCPISGKPAKADHALVINSKKLYFCCDRCPKAFIKKHGVIDKGPKECPISGRPAKDGSSIIFVKSKPVNFCCGNCKGKYIKKNFKDGKLLPKKKEKAKKKEPVRL